jgi:hypothetical protein
VRAFGALMLPQVSNVYEKPVAATRTPHVKHWTVTRLWLRKAISGQNRNLLWARQWIRALYVQELVFRSRNLSHFGQCYKVRRQLARLSAKLFASPTRAVSTAPTSENP